MTQPASRRAVASAALLCTAALAAACGSSGHGASGPPSPGTPTTAAPSTGAASASASASGGAGTARCDTSALKVKVNLKQVGAAAGSAYYPIDFTNVSGSSCTLFGYPGVSFAGGPAGPQIGRAAIRNPAVSATVVTLAPGAVAHATLQVAQAANYSPATCKPVAAHWLKIYPPNQATPVYAAFSSSACSAKLPQRGSQLGIYVVRTGPGKTGQAP